MFEITTDALVLDKEPSGEYDSRVFLYTKELGGVVARGTSMRKISSKLAAHFEPLNFVKVRLIQKNKDSAGFQIGDSLVSDRKNLWQKNARGAREALRLTAVLKESGFRDSPDPELWNFLEHTFSSPPEGDLGVYKIELLKVLGFDPAFALCARCESGAPATFSFEDMSFYCHSCQEVKTRLYGSKTVEFLLPELRFSPRIS